MAAMSPDADILAVQRDRVARAMRRARMGAGLDQTEFGRRMGELRGQGPLHRTTIGSWETGKSDPLALDLLNAAELAGVAAGGLLQPYEMAQDIAEIRVQLEQVLSVRVEQEQLRQEVRQLRRMLEALAEHRAAVR